MIFYPVLTENLNPPVSALMLELTERCLITAYPFAVQEKPIATLKWFAKNYGKRHVIFDSGLFTLVKEANKRNGGKPMPQSYYDRYFENYKRVLEHVPDHWLVIELDVHVMDGIKVEHYRKWFEKNGWADRTMHVWHTSEGYKAFKTYFERFKRIGCSQRELSFYGVDPQILHKMLKLCRPWDGHHVHLLGTAEEEFIHRYPDAFSCDASSWNSVALFGETRVGYQSARHCHQTGKVKSTPSVEKKVVDIMPRLMSRYREHPEYRAKTAVRVNYLRQLASGLLVFTDYTERVRRNSPGYRAGISDPIEYWESKGPLK